MRNIQPQYHRRARGNLSYIQFVHLVKRIWENTNPDIPMLATGGDNPAVYPSILHSLDLRRAHPEEPKMKFREVIDDPTGDTYVLGGQRFQNVVKFTVYTEHDPDLATEIMESFEDFMLEYTPVFKELGASEFVYSRRFSDTEENRSGAGVVKRAVAYLLTTEKLVRKKYDTLDEISIEARTWLEEAQLYPRFGERVSRADTSPRYYLQGPDAQLQFKITEPTSNGVTTITIPKSNFRSGDVLFLTPGHEGSFPPGLTSGQYEVLSSVSEDRFTADKTYVIERKDREESDPMLNVTGIGSGVAFYMPKEVTVNILDQQWTPPDEEED